MKGTKIIPKKKKKKRSRAIQKNIEDEKQRLVEYINKIVECMLFYDEKIKTFCLRLVLEMKSLGSSPWNIKKFWNVRNFMIIKRIVYYKKNC